MRSKYAKKQKRKLGNGTISPHWMSWSENPKAPPRIFQKCGCKECLRRQFSN